MDKHPAGNRTEANCFVCQDSRKKMFAAKILRIYYIISFNSNEIFYFSHN